MASWLSAHLFYSGNHADDVIRNIVRPFASGHQLRFFFIRYGENGPHIRFRMQVTDRVSIMSALEEVIRRQADIRLVFVPYEREIERYGNAATIEAAEEQFMASTTAVLQCADRQFFTAALQMHLAFFSGMRLNKEMCLALCRLFVQQWLPMQDSRFLAQFERQFRLMEDHLLPAVAEARQQAPDDMEEWRYDFYRAHHAIADVYAAQHFGRGKFLHICSSFMHMTHNRLGIPNREEAYIVYLLYRCLKNMTDE